MIIDLSVSGNMCNRLLQFSHCIAIGIRNNQNICHLFLGDMNELFDFNDTMNIHIKVYGGILKNRFCFKLRKIIELLYLYNDYKSYEIKSVNNNSQIINRISNHRVNFVNTWYIRDYDSLKLYRNEIKKVIVPKKIYRDYANDEIAKLRTEFTTVVGVHIRRGDYKSWHDGIFYYTDDQYYSLIEQMYIEFSSLSLKPVFLIFSNEKLNNAYFERKGIRTKVFHGSPIEDFTLLSCCDYIIGPPSTYSWFAHYLGNSKYKVIFSPEKQIHLNDFTKEITEEINSYNLYKYV